MPETTEKNIDFQESYFRLRSNENRIYTNEQLKALPLIQQEHPLYAEWRLRQQSAEKLIDYLQKKKKPLRILEAGCGNGWLCNRLAADGQNQVTGIDRHQAEIRQAREVFGLKNNLEFLGGDFLNTFLQPGFDIIIFAASIQYFPGLHEVMKRAKSLVSPDGEIHIIDSHFYHDTDRSAAMSRSAAHFDRMKVPGMTQHYHHHRWTELESYNPQILYKPNRILSRLGWKQNPFPWLLIKK